jgi:dihydroxyacetone kinase-like predicted kinase
VEAVRDAHPELEVEMHEGGQPHYPLLFAVE